MTREVDPEIYGVRLTDLIPLIGPLLYDRRVYKPENVPFTPEERRAISRADFITGGITGVVITGGIVLSTVDTSTFYSMFQ